MSNQVANFVIPGTPVSKQRPRVMRNGFTYTPKKTVDHERLIQQSFKLRCPRFNLTEKKLRVSFEFYFTPPKSTSKKKYNELINKTCDNNKDLDNLIKTVLDALNKVAYKDDRQVVCLTAQKLWAENSFTKVEIEEIEENSNQN